MYKNSAIGVKDKLLKIIYSKLFNIFMLCKKYSPESKLLSKGFKSS